VIYDLDAGRPERPPRSSAGRTALTVGIVGLSIAFFSALAFWPGERARQTPIAVLSYPQVSFPPRPSFVTRPVPDQALTFPPDVATATFRITSQGQTGLVSSDTIATTYRLRATGDMVTVAPLPLSETLPYPAPPAGAAAVRVRGRDAQWTTANGTSAVRWVENGVSFEMSSRTLSVAQLADLASRLR
jgi:hypothetical protein